MTLWNPWNSPGRNTGVGSLSLLQEIFPTQVSNPGLPHCRWILYQLSHRGSPGIVEWVACPFSRGSSRPRNQTRVSCIWDSLVAQMVKSLPAMQETQVRSLGQEDPWRRKWEPTPVFLPGRSHGRRSLGGYSPWGCKELETTERLDFRFNLLEFYRGFLYLNF